MIFVNLVGATKWKMWMFSFIPMLGCQHDIDCFQVQYGSVLGKRCDAFFRFNIKQGTMGKMPVSRSSSENCWDIYEYLKIISSYWILCSFSFLSESIQCKKALVMSSCGEHSGLLTWICENTFFFSFFSQFFFLFNFRVYI